MSAGYEQLLEIQKSQAKEIKDLNRTVAKSQSQHVLHKEPLPSRAMMLSISPSMTQEDFTKHMQQRRNRYGSAQVQKEATTSSTQFPLILPMKVQPNQVRYENTVDEDEAQNGDNKVQKRIDKA